MINLVWVMAGIVFVITMGLFLGFLYASIYDIWYQRKYAAWIALQEDHNRPQRPAAK